MLVDLERDSIKFRLICCLSVFIHIKVLLLNVHYSQEWLWHVWTGNAGKGGSINTWYKTLRPYFMGLIQNYLSVQWYCELRIFVSGLCIFASRSQRFCSPPLDRSDFFLFLRGGRRVNVEIKNFIAIKLLSLNYSISDKNGNIKQ